MMEERSLQTRFMYYITKFITAFSKMIAGLFIYG